MGQKSSRVNISKAQRDTFRNDALNAHNSYRKAHGVPTLKMTKKLNKYAQNWADRLAKAGKLEHRSNRKYGECIAWQKSQTGMTGNQAVEKLYNEINQYDWNRPEHSPATGHFTQVVWKSSRELGIGYCVNPKDSKDVYAVFNYNPAGNVVDKYKENVLPKKK
ncbi:Golgi-associated plant pathogenesis-related protein 1-like [Ptychodera flava]|uniref:Golgi-associated plant pathogenesis-related protein 1-like n=1 Tax=Ptychodera flava TaxID=63121 RepID=UPI00396A53D4